MNEQDLIANLTIVLQSDETIKGANGEINKLKDRLKPTENSLPVDQAQERRYTNRYLTSQIGLLEKELEKTQNSRKTASDNILSQLDDDQPVKIDLGKQGGFSITKKTDKLYQEKPPHLIYDKTNQ